MSTDHLVHGDAKGRASAVTSYSQYLRYT